MSDFINAISLPEAPGVNTPQTGEKGGVLFSDVMQSQMAGEGQTPSDIPSEEQSALKEQTTSEQETSPEEASETLGNETEEKVLASEGLNLAMMVGQLYAQNLLIEMGERSQVPNPSTAVGPDGAGQQQTDSCIKGLGLVWEEGGPVQPLGLEGAKALVNGVLKEQICGSTAPVEELTQEQASGATPRVELIMQGQACRVNAVVDGTAQAQSAVEKALVDAALPDQTPVVSVPTVEGSMQGRLSLGDSLPAAPGSEIVAEGVKSSEIAAEGVKPTGLFKGTWKSSKDDGLSEVKQEISKAHSLFSNQYESRAVPAPGSVNVQKTVQQSMLREMGLQWLPEGGKDASLDAELGRCTQDLFQPQQTSMRLTHAATSAGSAGAATGANGVFPLHYSLRNTLTGGPLHLLNLKVEPPDLGPLHMKVQVRGEEVRALFLTEGSSQKVIVERGLPALRQGLLEQGFSVQDLQVQVGTHGGGQTLYQPPQNGRIAASGAHNPACEGPQLENQETKPQDRWQDMGDHILHVII
jgi:flagellar hook-length control protein FliK